MPMGTCSEGLRAKAVVALGNPDRADDGVAFCVLSLLSPAQGVEFLPSLKTGMDLALSLLGYEKVLVVDADPALPPGEVRLVPLAAGARRTFVHGLGLAESLELLRGAGFAVPEVGVLAIGVPPVLPFGRGLSPEVERALPKAKEVVEAWLRS